MRFLDELSRYSPALTIFSVFMIAGSFIGTMKEELYAMAGLLLFLSGFLGVFWCLVESLKNYITQKQADSIIKQIRLEILKILSWSLILTIIIAVILFFQLLYVGSMTIYSRFSLVLKIVTLVFLYVLISVMMVRYYVPAYIQIFKDIKKLISILINKLKKKKR